MFLMTLFMLVTSWEYVAHILNIHTCVYSVCVYVFYAVYF